MSVPVTLVDLAKYLYLNFHKNQPEGDVLSKNCFQLFMFNHLCLNSFLCLLFCVFDEMARLQWTLGLLNISVDVFFELARTLSFDFQPSGCRCLLVFVAEIHGMMALHYIRLVAVHRIHCLRAVRGLQFHTKMTKTCESFR